MHPIISYVIINFCLIFGVIILGELVARYSRIKPAIMRKLMHIATGATVIFGAAITSHYAYIIVGLAMVAGLVFTRKVLPLRSVHDRFESSQGEVYFALGTALAAGITTNLTDFIACMAILTLADTAAYIAGNAMHSTQLTHNKTVAGSVACMLVTVAIMLGLHYPLPVALIVSVYVTAAEILSTRGSDNATIPGITACILAFISTLS